MAKGSRAARLCSIACYVIAFIVTFIMFALALSWILLLDNPVSIDAIKGLITSDHAAARDRLLASLQNETLGVS